MGVKNRFMNAVKDYMCQVGEQARAASAVIGRADTGLKNSALLSIASLLDAQRGDILKANQQDMRAGQEKGLEAALLDRLELNDARIDAMIEGLHQVASLPDPCGEITDLSFRPSGIQVGKMRVPLGVIGIIYESRPNVTIDAASLCLKSGNACILRGGSEAAHSNQAIAQAIYLGLAKVGLPEAVVQVLSTTDREAVGELITSKNVDVIIPRGGRSLIERVSSQATVPVIKHLDGLCHVYVHSQADLDKAFAIALNAKTHRYGVCNAMETLLVDQAVAEQFLPRIIAAYQEQQVEVRGCSKTCDIVPVNAASELDWSTEYLAPVVSIKVVDDFDSAVAHIETYGSHHTDAIVTESITVARAFMTEVNSASVVVNASTRFADGFEYGLGAEIGISTDKIHARGPVGLEGLTSQKWVVLGDGHIRQ